MPDTDLPPTMADWVPDDGWAHRNMQTAQESLQAQQARIRALALAAYRAKVALSAGRLDEAHLLLEDVNPEMDL